MCEGWGDGDPILEMIKQGGLGRKVVGGRGWGVRTYLLFQRLYFIHFPLTFLHHSPICNPLPNPIRLSSPVRREYRCVCVCVCVCTCLSILVWTSP